MRASDQPWAASLGVAAVDMPVTSTAADGGKRSEVATRAVAGRIHRTVIRHTGGVRGALLLEFLILFCVLPAGLAFRPLPGWPIPILWTGAIYCFVVLWRKPDFRTRELWRPAAVPMQWRSILAFFLPVAAIISVAVYFLAPRVFLNLPRRQPFGWVLVMLLYPLLSVVPQTLVYRAFIFTRYRLLFPSVRAMLLASAAAFSWVHIVMRNPVAPLLTLPAGVLFAWRYKKTGSVMVSALEHALYGCLIFTIGLGGYFYTGAVR